METLWFEACSDGGVQIPTEVLRRDWREGVAGEREVKRVEENERTRWCAGRWIVPGWKTVVEKQGGW